MIYAKQIESLGQKTIPVVIILTNQKKWNPEYQFSPKFKLMDKKSSPWRYY